MRGTVAKRARRFINEEAAKGNVPEGVPFSVLCRRAKDAYKESKRVKQTPTHIPIYPRKRHKGESLMDFRLRRAITHRRRKQRRFHG